MTSRFADQMACAAPSTVAPLLVRTLLCLRSRMKYLVSMCVRDFHVLKAPLWYIRGPYGYLSVCIHWGTLRMIVTKDFNVGDPARRRGAIRELKTAAAIQLQSNTDCTT